MKSEIATMLADELESGRWKKHKGRLGTEGGARCCLGVLQDIAPPAYRRSALYEPHVQPGIATWAQLTLTEQVRLSQINDGSKDWTPVVKQLREWAK